MSEAYLNQVRLLLRVLPLVAQEEVFALKGGTAINLFERNLPRLSVDIDLTYVPFDDRAVALGNIEAALGRIKTKIENSLDGITVTKVQQGDGTEAKLHCQYQRAQIKIEVNTIMRGHIFAPRMMVCTDKVQEQFEAFAEIVVVSKGELYGGKICAALDRQHPRDLFDVKHLLDDEGLTPDIKQGMIAGLLSHPRPISEVLYPTFKDQRAIFDAQFAGMAFDPFSYEEYEATRIRMNAAVQAALTTNDKAFLLSFKAGEPDWSLTDIPDLSRLPAVQWKLANILKLKANNAAKHSAMLATLSKRLSSSS
jgi:predicted nucleotidyltransferase component of viral defense system